MDRAGTCRGRNVTVEVAEPSTAPGTFFGALLRQHRLAAGLTQEALAECAGISVRSIRDFERGVARTPHRDTVALLCDALGLSPDAFAAAHEARASVVTPLIGRSQEIAVLDRHLAGVGPPMLALVGEPG